MDASRKRARTGSTSAEDRLSALPDALIHTIMSFLKAHQVVRTCVLAKRWMHLWRSVPYLDIDLPEFNGKIEDRGAIQARYDKFVDFADYLLVHRHEDGSLLDTFQLRTSYTHRAKPEDAARWVRRGLKCFPRVFHFQNDCDLGYGAKIPLELWSGGPPHSCRLTKLHLLGMSLNCSFAEQISSVCDVLEELELKRCKIDFQKIAPPSLENLIIDCCEASNKQLNVTAPRLASLHLNLRAYYGPVVLILNEMSSLVKASIHNRISSPAGVVLLSSLSNVTSLELSFFHERPHDSIFSPLLIMLFWSLCNPNSDILLRMIGKNVNFMKTPMSLLDSLRSPVIKQAMMADLLPDEEPVEFPTFKNLTTLLLDDCELGDKFLLLRHFLHNSPNLERLIVKCCQFSKASRKGKGKAKSKITSSQCQDAVHFSCWKLKYTEIIYEQSHNIGPLVNLLLDASDRLPKNTITLTKVEAAVQSSDSE